MVVECGGLIGDELDLGKVYTKRVDLKCAGGECIGFCDVEWVGGVL